LWAKDSLALGALRPRFASFTLDRTPLRADTATRARNRFSLSTLRPYRPAVAALTLDGWTLGANVSLFASVTLRPNRSPDRNALWPVSAYVTLWPSLPRRAALAKPYQLIARIEHQGPILPADTETQAVDLDEVLADCDPWSPYLVEELEAGGPEVQEEAASQGQLRRPIAMRNEAGQEFAKGIERKGVIALEEGDGADRLIPAVRQRHISTSPGIRPMPSLIATRSAWT
jgi:hypothetical protein